MSTPFLAFEGDFHALSALVGESSAKLSPSAAESVAALAAAALLKSFLQFCSDQNQTLRKLRPALVPIRRASRGHAADKINPSFKRLIGRNILSLKEVGRIRAFAANPKRMPLQAWSDDSLFVFGVAVKLARESAIAAKRGLDPARKADAKTIAAADKLLVARFDNLA